MVPCAQGRVIVETTRPAPPHFATCSTYRRPLVSSTPNEIPGSIPGTSSSGTQTDQQSTPAGSSSSKGAISKNIVAGQGAAARPDDLGVTPWYHEDYPTTDTSPGPTADRILYPSYSYIEKECVCRPELTSTRNSSIESEIPRPALISTAPRKAYMDLRDAIALLDETCPNQEPSPSLTPRTPRTPLTPYPRNKRARSKSSDNSSNYSNDRLSDRSFETTRVPEKDKKRPFLKKIGISKTEDRPFLAKLAPKIIGKPYLEKIGPSKAIEKPFLDKIGSSKTLDKFTFETPRYERKAAKSEGEKAAVKENVKKGSQELIKDAKEKPQKSTLSDRKFVTERRRSGKGYLLKMYSFETEDLESTVQPKEHRDPFRGSSFDDVLDSGPSSLPPMENIEDQRMKPELEQRPTSVAELLKCRVTTSEEIIYSSASHSSPREANSWSNSPRKKRQSKRDCATSQTPTHRREVQNSREGLRSDESTPNSPTKRPISTMSPDRQIEEQHDGSVYSPAKTRRQTFEDILEQNGKDGVDMKIGKQAQFERRGISSDNLLSRDTPSFSLAGHRRDDFTERRREANSEDSLASRGVQEYTKETFKQLQDKFRYHEIPTETYADFKRRTKGNLHGTIGRQVHMKTGLITMDDRDEALKDSVPKTEEPPADTTELSKPKEESNSGPVSEVPRSQGTMRSVLRKQERVEHQSDQELDTNASIRRPKRRIFHEPSQETMDLLTELRKVKSLLKTPSWETDLDLDIKPTRMPKRILLTDKEFCLSVERENSIRRPSKTVNTLEKSEIEASTSDQQKPEDSEEQREEEREIQLPGPALFEKKCLSLDYADEEKPQKPEARAISLASARNLPSEEEGDEYPDLGLTYDSKSCSSDVFNTPSEETNERHRGVVPESEPVEKANQSYCTDIDIAIPIDQKVSSPKGGVQIQGRTSDLYEIIYPRTTPFRVKKRLGKISVEENVKPESFTLGSKVDCGSAVAQKQTKCFPL